MMPLIQEFIIVQNEIISNKLEKNNSFNKIVGLIVSENLIIQEDLKLIKKVNFYEIKSIKEVFKEIIEMNKEEKYNLIQNDCELFQKGSIILWIKDLLSQLKNVLLTNQNKERVEEGFGLDFCYYLISKSFTKLNPKKFQALLKNSSHRLFLLNLKTIFSNIDSNILDKKNNEEDLDINNKSISDSYIDDNKKMINILNELSLDKNNIICLFTDESKDIFKKINLNPINFYFVAEDGLIIIVVGINREENIVVSGPDIISRGFVYVRESDELMTEARQRMCHTLAECSAYELREWTSLKGKLRDALSDYIFEKTKRNPMILPIIMEV